MEGTATTPRFRCNISETAKGVCSVDVTAELDDPEEATRIANVMLEEARADLKQRGRKIAGEE